eukprot:2875776-Amphidinium_carterae.1
MFAMQQIAALRCRFGPCRLIVMDSARGHLRLHRLSVRGSECHSLYCHNSNEVQHFRIDGRAGADG